ncbi:thiamine phosphate synthase [Pedobacter sp. SYP-B3415]|uniref:thiamine phosphate synthase n=1 Tax=Pedobacter sp. SYP-B3415 TaxID=2496641 RepID=UPI0013EC01BF|nr:thiamine phosphate synthase [Pedobacter sp. SYP-B3415]
MADPEPVVHETILLNDMFDAGLAHFHLRKRAFTARDMRNYVDSIRPHFRSRLSLHQHHDLAADFGTNRLHDNTNARLARQQFDAEMIYSTSVHNHEEYNSLPAGYAYAFFGPVFPSISKPGYGPTGKPGVSQHGSRRTPLIAIGGIKAANCREAAGAGFDGIAVLGAVWRSSDPLNAFLTIKETWDKQDRTH